MKSDNKRQPKNASMLPGSTKGNMEASMASSKAESKLPGSFVTMEAGADPNGPHMLDNGPRGDESVTNCQMGEPKRTVTGRDKSPYSVV